MSALFGLVFVLAGLAFIVADHPISRIVWRRAEEPEAGATTIRVLGLILFVSGGVTFLVAA